MILRRVFLKRMALAAAACALIDVSWPRAGVTIDVAAAGSLAEAVESAMPGDVIYLPPSLYTLDEPLVVRRGVAIDMCGSVVRPGPEMGDDQPLIDLQDGFDRERTQLIGNYFACDRWAAA